MKAGQSLGKMSPMLRFPRMPTVLATMGCWISFASLCAVAQTPKPSGLPAPGEISDVTSISDTTQTYALFLPSQYSKAKLWPIIYFFDPAGRGRRPLGLYKEVAEQYGFIVAGSNNSRNFGSDQSKAVNAVWEDTHRRLALDDHRSYAGGFSGGARVAGAMALSSPSEIAGVIAHGAGYPSNRSGSKDELPYFFAVGDEDFNWPEVMNIRREREEQGSPYRVQVFRGRHQWAPAAVMEEALQYMNLKAMQAGHLARDERLIDQVFEKTKAEAADGEARKDQIAQVNAYRSLVSDFSGLRDVKEFEAKLAALQSSAALKTTLRNEREQMSEQFKLEQEIAPRIDALAGNSVPDAASLRLEIGQQIGALRDQAKHSKNEGRRLICSRAFSGIFARAMEGGQQELGARHFEKAEAYFDLMRQVTDDPWPLLALADTHAASGNRRLAIKDLQDAIHRGLKDKTVLESDTTLQVLKDDPEFKKLMSSLGESR